MLKNTSGNIEVAARLARTTIGASDKWREDPDLRCEQEKVNLREKCLRLERRGFWAISYRQTRVRPYICQKAWCNRQAVTDIIVNCWGTMVEVASCKIHASCHGKRIDSF